MGSTRRGEERGKKVLNKPVNAIVCRYIMVLW